MTKWRGIPTQCVIQMDYLNELMEEWLYRRDETLLLNVNPWSAAQLCNIYDQRQKKRFTAIADDSVWNSSPYRNWRFLKNVDDSKNLREVLATFPFETAIFLSTDPHYCTELWEPLTLENKREMKEECARFISNTHEQFNKILPALHQDMACAYLDKEYAAFTTYANMINIYTAFWFGDRYGAAKMHWDLLMELSYPP